MTILGIETSCDETSVAIVEDGTKLLAHTLASSQQLHEKYKGIVPDQAAREQLKYIIPVLHETMEQFVGARRAAPTMMGLARQTPTEIDALAVTVGPGLIGSLLIGVETAKALALAWNKPLIPVNHLIGHIYANWIETPQTVHSRPPFIVHSKKMLTTNYQLPTTNRPPQFPALVLLVSGGHTELVLMQDHGKFKKIGSTLDDAAGECFDKCGRVLGLQYPYGPYVEAEASKFRVNSSEFVVKLPRPLINSKDFNFSFSGLKTAFINEYNKLTANCYPLTASSLAFELQEAITDVLVIKTINAAKKYHPKSLLLAGGVAANKCLREKLRFSMNYEPFSTINLHVPPIPLCTDNAVYIASCAFFNNKPILLEKINANPELDIN